MGLENHDMNMNMSTRMSVTSACFHSDDGAITRKSKTISTLTLKCSVTPRNSLCLSCEDL